MSRSVPGVQPVLEAIKGGQPVQRILLARGSGGATHRIREAAKSAGIPCQTVQRGDLDRRLGHGRHQGVVALLDPSPALELTVETLVDQAEAEGEVPLILLLDEIQDVHNLGAILRSAHALGAHGAVLPKNRAAQVTDAVVKASAGAALHVPVVRVTNIKHAMEDLKSRGVWLAAADAEGEPADQAPLDGPLGLVVGSEAKGVRPTVAQRCDHRVAIPQVGEFDSLNASVAAGILLYEVQRQRRNGHS